MSVFAMRTEVSDKRCRQGTRLILGKLTEINTDVRAVVWFNSRPHVGAHGIELGSPKMSSNCLKKKNNFK